MTDNSKESREGAVASVVSAIVEAAATVVSSYASNNQVSKPELPKLMGEMVREIASSVGDVGPIVSGTKSSEQSEAARAVEEMARQPGMTDPFPARSEEDVAALIDGGKITCLECRKPFTLLQSHLWKKHGLKPEEYLQRWNLPKDFPMSAPEYRQVRREAALVAMGQDISRRDS